MTIPLLRKRRHDRWMIVAAAAAAACLGFGVVWLGSAAAVRSEVGGDPLDAWRLTFQRPTSVPYPPDNPPSTEKIALGKRLFEDPGLSANGKLACATCHVPALAFTDGVALGKGLTGERLPRHTPSLWNLAWGETYFWDGRARALEEQVKGPIENPIEMGEQIGRVARRLAANPTYADAFARAFPQDPQVSVDNLERALAAYERTLISPPTRFDRWVSGDGEALSESEIAGFRLFVGKAQCINCHSGWSFTDHAFYDIGLPGKDLGRGKELHIEKLDHAFKTPSLRELAWTAPYMHDGSLATLDDVLNHYEHGIVERPTLAPDLPRITLTAEEHDNLLAFLATLSSESPPVPQPLGSIDQHRAAKPAEPEPAVDSGRVSQREKRFRPEHVHIGAGTALSIVNDDIRTHNVRVFDKRFMFDSGAQEPGQTVSIKFPEEGRFEVICGIHPQMKLTVDVTK